MKKLLLTAAVLATALAALPAMSSALNITSSRSRTLSGSLRAGTSAVFVEAASGLRVTCTTHTVRIITTDLSTIGDPRPGTTSTATSAVIRQANNSYSSSVGTAPPLCDYTIPALGTSGSAAVGVSSDWILTVETTSSLTLPTATNNATIVFFGGLFNGASVKIDAQSLAATMTSNANRTIVTFDIRDRTIRATCTPSPPCLDTSGTLTLTESLVVPTMGAS
jgi:hypothetical protein